MKSLTQHITESFNIDCESFNIVNEAFKNADVKDSIAYIDDELGSNPGYLFFGEDDDIEAFDKLWKSGKYANALDMLVKAEDLDIVDLKTLKKFIVTNEVMNEAVNDAPANIVTESEELVNDAASKWTLNSTGKPEMYRFSGRTFPQIMFFDGEIIGRDDNGKHVSATLKTSDISLAGVQSLLTRGISTPHPSTDDIKEFLTRCK